jgi:outer membrane protein TolC
MNELKRRTKIRWNCQSVTPYSRISPGKIATRIFIGLALFAAPALLSAQVSLATLVDMAAKNSAPVRTAQADLDKARAALAQSHDAFIPTIAFGSGLPAFPSIGFTGNLPTIWDANVSSLVFSMPQIRYIRAAKLGVEAAVANLKDAHEQVALDTSTAYIELDTVNQELAVVQQQESFANRLVEIEQKRAEAGVDPLSDLLQAKLTAAQLKLKRLHLETRIATLAQQLSALTAMPVASIITDHASIPAIPAIRATEARPLSGIQSANFLALSKQYVAMGEKDHSRMYPEIGFGVQYNRSTTLLNEINKFYAQPLPPNNFSSGFSIRVPLFDWGARDKAKQSAAEALRAKVEAEQAEKQNDAQIANLNGTLRELDAQAEVAGLKKQISDEQLKTVQTQLELGNGGGSGPGAPAQLTPKAEQQVHIDERQNYQESLDADLNLSRARLGLLRALGHMQDWLNELH